MIWTNGSHRSKFVALWKKRLVDRHKQCTCISDFLNIVGNGKSAVNDGHGHGREKCFAVKYE